MKDIETNALIIPKTSQKKETRDTKMIIMIVVILIHMLAELIVGIIGNSLTLLSDAFHMLADSFAMMIGLVSVRLGKRKQSDKLTFGYKRAEILGAFFNATFLCTIAFFISTEILSKFISPEGITEPDAVLWTSVVGIILIIVGLIVIGHDGHDHHGHSHGHSHSHGENCDHEHNDEEEHEHGEHCHHDNKETVLTTTISTNVVV